MRLLRKLRSRIPAALDSLARCLRGSFFLYLAAVFTVLVVLDAAVFHVAYDMKQKAFDLIMRHRIASPKPDPDIVIVDINEASLAAMAGEYGRWPWPRQVLGEFLEHVEKQQPRAVVFDILFSDPDVYNPDSDAYFNAAIAATDNTFFPFLRLDESSDPLSRIKPGMIPGVSPLANPRPDATIAVVLPHFEAALAGGRLGFHNIYPDSDGVVREYRLYRDDYGWRFPSLPLTIARTLGFSIPSEPSFLLNWRGQPFSYRFVGFADVFNDMISKNKQRPPDEFKGKIVVIGSTAASLFDLKPSPMSRQHPGVEILATAIDNVKHGDYLRSAKGELSHVLLSLIVVWAVALGFFNNLEREKFGRIFGMSQFFLLAVSYASINLTTVYVDLTAPVTIGFAYYSVARIYAMAWDRAGSMFAVPSGGGTARAVLLLIYTESAGVLDDRGMRKFCRSLERLGSYRKSVSGLRGAQKGVWGLFSNMVAVAWMCGEEDDSARRGIELEAVEIAAQAGPLLSKLMGGDVRVRHVLHAGTFDRRGPLEEDWRRLFGETVLRMDQTENALRKPA